MRSLKKTRRALMCAALALALAAVFAASWAGAVPAAGDGSLLNETDRAELLAFWQQEAYGGMNNGEAVYDIALGDGGFLEEPAPQYDGGCITHLIQTGFLGSESIITSFDFNYSLPGWQGEAGRGNAPRLSPLVTVYPDLYGPLDLHGSSVRFFGSPVEDQTHITRLDLNDCPNLVKLVFCGQYHCAEVTALSCPNLNYVKLLGGAYKAVKFHPFFTENPVEASAFGGGSVGAWYQAGGGSIQHASVFAYPDGDCFVGWFEDGQLVSTELEYYNEAGGRLTACFGGDADGNGSIDVSDAVTVMRRAMAVTQTDGNDAMMDVNSNGTVDVADAALILRFALGL